MRYLQNSSPVSFVVADGLPSSPRAGGRRRGGPSGRDHYLPVRSRCVHPGQQQGRRWPSSSSSWVRRMRRSRVVSCLASSTQQMNSLRARGVMSRQASSAVWLEISALLRSRGSVCTTPPGTRGLLTGVRVAGPITAGSPMSAQLLVSSRDTQDGRLAA